MGRPWTELDFVGTSCNIWRSLAVALGAVFLHLEITRDGCRISMYYFLHCGQWPSLHCLGSSHALTRRLRLVESSLSTVDSVHMTPS